MTIPPPLETAEHPLTAVEEDPSPSLAEKERRARQVYGGISAAVVLVKIALDQLSDGDDFTAKDLVFAARLLREASKLADHAVFYRRLADD